jgi:hypothetical protein
LSPSRGWSGLLRRISSASPAGVVAAGASLVSGELPPHAAATNSNATVTTNRFIVNSSSG